MNPKFYHRFHNRIPLVPNQSQLNSIRTLLTNLSEIQFNVVFPSTTRSSMFPLYLRFSHKTFYTRLPSATFVACPTIPFVLIRLS